MIGNREKLRVLSSAMHRSLRAAKLPGQYINV